VAEGGADLFDVGRKRWREARSFGEEIAGLGRVSGFDLRLGFGCV
jgi:hypothetical protein